MRQGSSSSSWRAPLVAFLAGGLGGCSLQIVCQPFDLIKTRAQLQPQTGLGDVVRETWRVEGLRGFYRGALMPIAGMLPFYACAFGSFDMAKRLLGTGDRMGDLMLAGALSALPCTLVLTPIERVKILLMKQAERVHRGEAPRFRGPWHAVRALGLAGTYRGLLITAVRDVPFSGLYFGSYDTAKHALLRWQEGHTAPTTIITNRDGKRATPLWVSITAGSLAGMSWIPILGIDAIKSRWQGDDACRYRSLLHVLQSVVAEAGGTVAGVRALWRGTLPTVLRAVPGNAACFCTMEAVRTYLNNALDLNPS